MLIGIALGAGLLFLIIWLRGRGVNLAWYEWVLGLLGLALIIFACQNYQASVAEFQPKAPQMFLLIFGLPGFLILALAIFLVWLRYYRAGKEVGTGSGTKKRNPIATYVAGLFSKR